MFLKHISRLACIMAILLYTGCSSQAQKASSYTQQIDSFIQTTAVRSFNGVVLVAQQGRTLYVKAYGIADPATAKPLQAGSRFSTMSIAKQVTAALVLREVEKGTIDLHVPIRKYLPDLKYSWADTITMHHLLNHTSGLESDNLDKPLKFSPGSAFSYSNMGYALAGKVLEKQSGQTFEQLVTALFRRCGMRHSGYPGAAYRKLMVKGCTVQEDGTRRRNEKVSFVPELYFGSNLGVTAPDLARWNECLHGGKLLQPASYRLMTHYTVTAVHNLFAEQPIGYGYGLRINDKDSIPEIGHTGFHPGEGFTAVNLYYPETGISVIVLENQGYENFDIAYYFEQGVRSIVRRSGLLQPAAGQRYR